MATFTLKHKDGTQTTGVATTIPKATRGDLTINMGNAVYELEYRDASGNHTYRWVREEGMTR